METITIENVCRFCLAEHKGFSEPLSNWIDNVLLLFRRELFLDDGLPQQICLECSHTLMITTKLREMAYKTDMLLKTDKSDLKNDNFFNFEYKLNETPDTNINIHKATKSEEYTYKIEKMLDVKFTTEIKSDLENVKFVNFNYKSNETPDTNININIAIKSEELDVEFNYPKLNDSVMDSVFINSRPIIKSDMRVMLEKLPDHISSNSLIYCSKCLLAFTDSFRFNIHLNLNTHNTNKCSYCSIKYENGTQLWKHINSVHVDEILKMADIRNIKERIEPLDELTLFVENRLEYHSKMSEERLKKKAEHGSSNMTEQQIKMVEYGHKWSTYMTEEQQKKAGKSKHQPYANTIEEQRKKNAEYFRKRYQNMTEEQRKRKAEYNRKWHANAKITEEQREKKKEYNRKIRARKTEEQKQKKRDDDRKWRASMTEERRAEKLELRRQWRANLTVEQREKMAEYSRKWRESRIAEQKMNATTSVLRQCD